MTAAPCQMFNVWEGEQERELVGVQRAISGHQDEVGGGVEAEDPRGQGPGKVGGGVGELHGARHEVTRRLRPGWSYNLSLNLDPHSRYPFLQSYDNDIIIIAFD